jgi:S1-C subfamily serine protease
MLVVRKRGWLLSVAAAVAFASPVSPAQSQQGLPGFIEPQPAAVAVPVPYSANFSLSPNFVVDGLALGGEVYPDSAIYKSYACRQSDDFAGFTWCRVHHTKMSKFGRYTSWVTILHSGANKVAFITQAIIPAFFQRDDVDRELQRLSRGFGRPVQILRVDSRPDVPNAVLAAWGAVTLTPLDDAAMGALRRGEQIHRGLIAEFIGDPHKSARIGLPVYSIGGGPGYLWGASFDDAGRGSLRISAVNVSEIGSPGFAPGEASRPSPIPAPSPATPEPQQEEPHAAKSTGTGFFITIDGRIITNAHVVGDCSEIHVGTGQGNYSVAHLLARDTTNDLALLKVDASPTRVAALRYAVRLGENVEAFGYPLSQLLATSGNFTTGNVTALAGIGDDSRYLQVSAPVQPGNSGGPLLDENGNLVGIVTF